MKEKYEEIQCEVIIFEKADVIADSDGINIGPKTQSNSF